MIFIITHLLGRDSSWWGAIGAASRGLDAGIILTGSAAYMAAEGWLAEAAGGLDTTVLRIGFSVPAGVKAMDASEFAAALAGAKKVISI